MKLYREICLQVVFVLFLVCMMAWWMIPVHGNRSLYWISFDTAWYYKQNGIHLQLPKREYLNIELDSSQAQNKVSLDFAQLYIHQIIAKEDTIHGVHFHFGSGAKYEHLIRVLDVLISERAERYQALPEDIWFFYCP